MEENGKNHYDIYVDNLYLEIILTLRTPPKTEPEIPKETVPFIRRTLHVHSFAEVFFCDAGEVWLKSEEGLHCLLPGDIALIPPNFKHIMLPYTADTRFNSLGVSLHKRYTKGTRKLYQTFLSLLLTDQPVILRGQYDVCSRVVRFPGKSDESDKTNVLMLKLIGVLADMADSIGGDEAPDADRDRSSDVHTHSLERLITVHFMNDLKVNEAAERLFLSTRQLERICRERYGVTFRQAIIDRRVEVAAEMLKTSALSVSQIGAKVGFNSRVSFSRTFAGKFGLSPSQYRSRYLDRSDM